MDVMFSQMVSGFSDGDLSAANVCALQMFCLWHQREAGPARDSSIHTNKLFDVTDKHMHT